MPQVATGRLVADAREAWAGIPAFNVITLEHAEGIVAGAEAAGAPTILQVSQNAVRFHGGRLGPLAAACRSIARDATVGVALHLDHVDDLDLLHQAPEAGFDSAMYDASTMNYAENVTATRSAADWAHSRGLWLEAELGEVGGKDGAHAPWVRTDPAEAKTFVAATGVDALAVAVGSSHAMSDRTAQLDHGLITELRDAAGVPLVLHGSSGVPYPELRRAVDQGITKINIGTALNIAFTGELRHTLAVTPDTVDPRPFLRQARDAIALTVSEILRHLTTAGLDMAMSVAPDTVSHSTRRKSLRHRPPREGSRRPRSAR